MGNMAILLVDDESVNHCCGGLQFAGTSESLIVAIRN